MGVPRSEILAAGPAYIAGVLRQAGHSVTGHVFRSAKEFQEVVSSGKFDIMATGGLCSQYRAMKCMVDIAHQAGLKTIVGGGIVSSEPELMTRDLQTDYSVLGQGEMATVELLEALTQDRDLAMVRGLGFCRDGRFIQTPDRPEIEDLDALPFPDYEVFGFRGYLDALKPSDRDMLNVFDHPREYPLIASRSCPYRCSFCYHPSGYKYRRRSLDSIMAEFAEVVPKYRINLISFWDELFSVDEERLLEFCERFRAFQAKVSWEIKWFCCLHLSGLKPQTLAVLRKSGCYMVSYGFESYSPVVLKSMRKNITPEQIHSAVHETLNQKLIVQANFIFSDRAETLTTAEETLSFWRSHKEAGINLSPMVVCPNSPDYQYCIRRGLITDRLDHIHHHLFDTINMTAMPDRDFQKLILEIFFHNIKEIVWISPLKRTTDTLTILCPHCHEIVTYRNYHTPLLFKHRMICRACTKRFFVSGLFYMLFQKIVATLAPHSAISCRIYIAVRNLWYGKIREVGQRLGLIAQSG